MFRVKIFGRTLTFGKESVDVERLEKRVGVLEQVVVEKHRDIETMGALLSQIADNYNILAPAVETICDNQRKLADPLGWEAAHNIIPSSNKRFDRYEEYPTIACLKQRLGMGGPEYYF